MYKKQTFFQFKKTQGNSKSKKEIQKRNLKTKFQHFKLFILDLFSNLSDMVDH